MLYIHCQEFDRHKKNNMLPSCHRVWNSDTFCVVWFAFSANICMCLWQLIHWANNLIMLDVNHQNFNRTKNLSPLAEFKLCFLFVKELNTPCEFSVKQRASDLLKMVEDLRCSGPVFIPNSLNTLLKPCLWCY